MRDVYKIKSLEIKGYKSISLDCPLIFKLGDINILLGANGAGKSNIISFFKMLSYMMSGRFPLYVEQSGTNRNLLHYGPQKTAHISAKLRFENSKSYDEYKFTLATATPDRLIITEETVEWGWKESSQKPKLIQLKSNFTESALIGNKNKTIKTIHKILDNGCKVYQFHDSSAEGPLRQASPKKIGKLSSSRRK